MKRFSSITGLGVLLMLAIAAPSLAAKPKKAPSAPVDNSPVVTPDTTTPPVGTASPSGTVLVSPQGASSAPNAAAPASAPQSYVIPIGGAGQTPTAPSSASLHAVAQSAPAPAAAPQGPPEPPVLARAEQCLRANVERVVREEPSPKLAADFLLGDVCSDEVDAASLYVRNISALAHFNPESERGRAGLSVPHVDPETGEIISPPHVDVSAAVAADAAGRGGAFQIAANLRKYAAELVLNEKTRPGSPGKKGR
jgi:hypothetical protein